MQIQETKIAERHLLTIIGRLDVATANLLAERLEALIKAGERYLVIDCSQLNYLGSPGLRVWWTFAKRLTAANGQMLLAGAKSHVEEVIKLAGFDELIPRFSSVEAALETTCP